VKEREEKRDIGRERIEREGGKRKRDRKGERRREM